MRQKTTHRSGCPINLVLEVLGDRWSLLILRDAIFAGKRTFGEFLESDEAIATNVLTARLKSLVDDGFLTKSPDASHKQKVQYQLTEQAISLVPTLIQLGLWGQQWLPASPELAEGARRLFAGGPSHWNAIMDRLRERHLSA